MSGAGSPGPRAKEQHSWALLCIRATSGAHSPRRVCDCPQGLGVRFNTLSRFCWGGPGGHLVHPGQALVQPPATSTPGGGVLSPSSEAEQEAQIPPCLLLAQGTSATAQLTGRPLPPRMLQPGGTSSKVGRRGRRHACPYARTQLCTRQPHAAQYPGALRQSRVSALARGHTRLPRVPKGPERSARTSGAANEPGPGPGPGGVPGGPRGRSSRGRARWVGAGLRRRRPCRPALGPAACSVPHAAAPAVAAAEPTATASEVGAAERGQAPDCAPSRGPAPGELGEEMGWGAGEGEGPRAGPGQGAGAARQGLAGQRLAEQAARGGRAASRPGRGSGWPDIRRSLRLGTKARGDLRAEGHGPPRGGPARRRSR